MQSLPFRKVFSEPVWPAEPASFSCEGNAALQHDAVRELGAHRAAARTRRIFVAAELHGLLVQRLCGLLGVPAAPRSSCQERSRVEPRKRRRERSIGHAPLIDLCCNELCHKRLLVQVVRHQQAHELADFLDATSLELFFERVADARHGGHGVVDSQLVVCTHGDERVELGSSHGAGRGARESGKRCLQWRFSLFCPRWLLLTRQALARPTSERVAGRCRLLRRSSSKGRRRAVPRRAVPPRRAAARVLFAMSNTVLRREGDTVHLEHKYYGKFKFREAAPLADAAAASAMVFAGERTDGYAPPAARRAARRSPFAAADATPRAAARRRAWPSSSTTATRRVRKACPAFALRPDAGGRRTQVYSDHMHWSQLYYNPATRFAGLPWILSQTIPEAPWGDKKVDVMVSELLGDSLEAVRLRNPEVRCVSRGRCYARVSDGRSLPSARCRPVRCAASPCRRWTCWLPCTPPASCTATSSPPTCWRVACLARVANVP